MNTNIWIIITEQKFKNTFLPDCQNKELTLDQLRGGIKLGVIKPSQIPKEIRELLARPKKLSDDSSKKRTKGLSEIHELKDDSDEYYAFLDTHWSNGETHIRPAIKLKVFSHYSKKISNSDTPICACCEYSDIRFLVLDHIHSRKNLSELEKRLSGSGLYEYVFKKGFPKEFQVLCHNCNNAKSDKRYCPHQLDRMKN